MIGVVVHTFVLTPYHAWRLTHQTHHVRLVIMFGFASG